jgi:hypothetical protein
VLLVALVQVAQLDVLEPLALLVQLEEPVASVPLGPQVSKVPLEIADQSVLD